MRTFALAVAVLVGTGAGACAVDDSNAGTGGSTSNGGSSADGADGSDTGASDGDFGGSGGSGGSSGGTSGAGGDAASTGGSDAGGDASDGSSADGGLTAASETYVFQGEIDGQSLKVTCTKKTSSDPDSYTVKTLGYQLQVGCPDVMAAYSNPASQLAFEEYEKLPASFSFTEADAAGYPKKFTLDGSDRPKTYATLDAGAPNTTSVMVTGTHDAAKKRVTAHAYGVWQGSVAPAVYADGWLEVAFDVTYP